MSPDVAPIVVDEPSTAASRHWWPRLRRVLASRRPELAAITAFFLVAVAWALSNPPSAAPDEPSHYVRMLGMGNGDLIGKDVPARIAVKIDDPSTSADDVRAARLIKEAGLYRIPGSDRFQPPCNSGQPARPFNCPPAVREPTSIEALSFHARTLPASYVVPGVISRLVSGGNRRMYLGRLGFILQNTFLFGIATFLAAPMLRRTRGAASLLLLLALSPMLMFNMGVLSPDGTEATAMLAFTAAVLALADVPSRRRLWYVAALGAMAVLTRDLGLVFVPAVIVIAVAARPRVYRDAVRVARRADLGAAALGLGAFAGAVVWRMVLQYNTSDIDPSPRHLADALTATRHVFVSSFGIVGWLDVPHPALTPKLWTLTALVLVVVLALRNWRWALTAAAVAAVYIATSVYIHLTQATLGFGLQGRYAIVLAPVGVLLASLSFPAPRVSGAHRTARWVAALGATTIAALGHLSVLLQNARRHSNGLGSPRSFGEAIWSPPFGWTASLALFAVAAVWIAALPILVMRTTTEDRDEPGATMS